MRKNRNFFTLLIRGEGGGQLLKPGYHLIYPSKRSLKIFVRLQYTKEILRKHFSTENEILESKKVLMRLEHTAKISKYLSDAKQVGHGSNYEHIKYCQILKLVAIGLSSTVFKILLKSWKCLNMAVFLMPNVLVSFYKLFLHQRCFIRAVY